jgi:hypothetical protein
MRTMADYEKQHERQQKNTCASTDDNHAVGKLNETEAGPSSTHLDSWTYALDRLHELNHLEKPWKMKPTASPAWGRTRWMSAGWH